MKTILLTLITAITLSINVSAEDSFLKDENQTKRAWTGYKSYVSGLVRLMNETVRSNSQNDMVSSNLTGASFTALLLPPATLGDSVTLGSYVLAESINTLTGADRNTLKAASLDAMACLDPEIACMETANLMSAKDILIDSGINEILSEEEALLLIALSISHL